MSRKIVAGNWKMNLLPEEGISLIKKLSTFCDHNDLHGVEVVVAPPFIHIAKATDITNGHKLSIAAQNCATENSGAYTGEVSVDMIKATGAELVIVGHSERRQYYGETDAVVNTKLKKVLKAGLYPILCVGEMLEDRKAGRHETKVREQLLGALKGLESDDLENLIIAYEPVWAIGTGETATPQQAQDMHHFIRKHLTREYHASLADDISILYGGSVKADNAYELFSQPAIDGGLIGGASLDFDQFVEIIKTGKEVLR